MDDLVANTRRELKQVQRATWFWILLMLLSTGIGLGYEWLGQEYKVIKAYQIFYFLGVFCLLAFVVERIERARLARLIKNLIAHLEETAAKK